MTMLMDDLRSMPLSELKDVETDLRKKIFELRMKIQTDGTVLAEYRKSRKELARVLTVQGDKKRSGE